ncbi:hypothetical protein JCM16303_003300 [Sporobolomyces ruberrimus]
MAQRRLEGPERWRLLKDNELWAFVLELIPPGPPVTQHSLRHHRRIGFRQPAQRPDLKVLGLAQHGGYLF